MILLFFRMGALLVKEGRLRTPARADGVLSAILDIDLPAENHRPAAARLRLQRSMKMSSQSRGRFLAGA